MCAKSIINRS
ncbi:hypothetical protein F383_39439 [Gossypium arboreum]|uniref:Uncharacterized protein n=1 Tax=Gossypium arboreum TaxID=29729 RepID=A0A0B0MQS0_GOSAR|nr:hypothetical protein F383_39439 [Gossypium arboreum]